jgi:hypothetical protein
MYVSNTQFNGQVRGVRTDKRTEYVNNEFAAFLSAEGILHQTFCPDTLPQNGVALKGKIVSGDFANLSQGSKGSMYQTMSQR